MLIRRLLLVAAGALGLGLLYQAAGEALDRGRYRRGGSYAGRVWTRVTGGGAHAVLLESGLAATSLTWMPVQNVLSPALRVCSYDRAGLGWSHGRPTRPTLDSILEDLARVLQHTFPNQRPLLVGHSFGGLIVRMFAARRPDLVSGLLLLDPVSSEYWSPGRAADANRLRIAATLSRRGALLARFGIVRLLLTLLAMGWTELPKRIGQRAAGRGTAVMMRLTAQMSRLPRDLWPILRAHWSRPGSFSVMANYLEMLPRCCLHASDIAVPASIPVLILSAATATEAERLERDRWAAASTRGEHRIIPDSDHWLQLDHPAIVAQAIEQTAKQFPNP